MSQLINNIYNDDGEFRAKEAREIAQELPLYRQVASYSPHEEKERGPFNRLMNQIKCQGAAFYVNSLTDPDFDMTAMKREFDLCAEGWVITCRAQGHPILKETALSYLWQGFEGRDTIEVMSYKWRRIQAAEEASE